MQGQGGKVVDIDGIESVGGARVDGREVASSRAFLEQQLTCGTAEGPCLVMQKKKPKCSTETKRRRRGIAQERRIGTDLEDFLGRRNQPVRHYHHQDHHLHPRRGQGHQQSRVMGRGRRRSRL